jgi:hypothetical protein
MVLCWGLLVLCWALLVALWADVIKIWVGLSEISLPAWVLMMLIVNFYETRDSRRVDRLNSRYW